MLSQNFLKNSFPDLTTVTWRTWLDYHITYFIWQLTWITTHICQSHFSYTMDHGNIRWILQANFEEVTEVLKIGPCQSDQATSFLQNLLFFVMHFYAFRHWLLTIVLQRNFCHYAKQPILWYVLFSTFCSQKSSLC